MLPLASFLALQEIPQRPFGPTYAEQTYLAQGHGLLFASSWYRTLVGGGNRTIYSCGIADLVLKQQSLHFGWNFAGVALWCHHLLPLGCCWLKHTKMDRSSLEARNRLQGKGWLCLVLLWNAVTSSHDAAELCREKWSRQDEPDVFAAEDGVLRKSTPVLPGEHQHHAWLHVLPALKLRPILRSSGCSCVWLPMFVNLADPGKCFISFVSSPIRSRLFSEASSGGGFLRREWDFWLGDIFNTCCVLGMALAFPTLSLWLNWLERKPLQVEVQTFPFET